jgi:ribonuclease HI
MRFMDGSCRASEGIGGIGGIGGLVKRDAYGL